MQALRQRCMCPLRALAQRVRRQRVMTGEDFGLFDLAGARSTIKGSRDGGNVSDAGRFTTWA